MGIDHHITRRGFVGTTGAAAAIAGSFGIRTAASGRTVPPSEQVRLAMIGTGSRGSQLVDPFLANAEVEFVALADVDPTQSTKMAASIAGKRSASPAPKTMIDYRAILDDKSIDAVVIATPDHWHAQPTIQACQAGKDVYCEKPVAHNIREGQAMKAASEKYKKIIAIGTQQRSSENFQKAVEAVQAGKLGKITWVQTWNYENISPIGMGLHADEAVPEGVDYDRWLGPAPVRPFNRNRFHLLFRWYFDYAGGMMSDWGVHLNDIVLWALKAKGPKSVSSTGGIWAVEDDRDTPDTLQVVYEFDETILTYSMRKGNGLPMNDHGYGILFCGTEGSLLLDRSGHQIIPDQVITPYGIKLVYGDQVVRTVKLEPSEFKAKGDGIEQHVRNFLDCLKSREKPTTDIAIAHCSTNTTHLGNIAYKLGRKLFWDVETETFKNDEEANGLLGRTYRAGYELPQV
jgi:predicted dehydrogenase